MPTATFTINTYTLTVNIVGSGTVTKAPPGPTYPAGTVVTLTAIPGAGYAFDGWSGDLSGTTNPAQITMNSNKTVVANFAIVTTYSISGRVTLSNGAGLGDVIVSWGGSTQYTTTDSSGNYTISGLANNTAYLLTLAKTGYAFSPQPCIVLINNANVEQNFIATPEGGGGTYSISGTVYDGMNGGGMPLVRVIISSPGMQPVWVYTDSEGRYEITDLPDNRQYTVTPEYFYGQFFPESSTVDIDGYPVSDVNFWWWSS